MNEGKKIRMWNGETKKEQKEMQKRQKIKKCWCWREENKLIPKLKDKLGATFACLQSMSWENHGEAQKNIKLRRTRPSYCRAPKLKTGPA
jgi:hypothetical protein